MEKKQLKSISVHKQTTSSSAILDTLCKARNAVLDCGHKKRPIRAAFARAGKLGI
jgi:hypothetical protein